jgi:hypothetical protein
VPKAGTVVRVVHSHERRPESQPSHGAEPAPPVPRRSAADTVLGLQRTAGNAATAALLGRRVKGSLEESSANPNYGVELPGGASDAGAFWTAFAERHGEGEASPLSDDNKKLVEQGSPPAVDEKWVEHHPAQAGYVGDVLTHEPWDEGGASVALPQSFRRRFGGG